MMKIFIDILLLILLSVSSTVFSEVQLSQESFCPVSAYTITNGAGSSVSLGVSSAGPLYIRNVNLQFGGNVTFASSGAAPQVESCNKADAADCATNDWLPAVLTAVNGLTQFQIHRSALARQWSSPDLADSTIHQQIRFSAAGSFAITSLSIHARQPFRIDGIFPTSGPHNGATAITVFGKGFLNISSTNDRICRFSDGNQAVVTDVIPTYVSWDHIVCVAPVFASQRTVFSLEVNIAKIGFSCNGHTFTSLPVMTVSSVIPRRGSELGGTRITVSGANFDSTKVPWCRFSDAGSTNVEYIVAEILGAATLVCVSPKKVFGTVREVDLSTDKQNFVHATSFLYLPQIIVSSITPTIGTVSTIITISGANFPIETSYGTLKTKVGSELATPLSGSTSSTVVFAAPPQTIFGSLEVAVMYNDDEPSESFATFVYQDPWTEFPRANYTIPRARAEGTVVTVVGENFRDTTLLRCRFEFSSTVVVLATFVSENELSCVVPSIIGMGQIAVSNNNHDFSIAKAQFFSIPNPSLSSVFVAAVGTTSFLGRRTLTSGTSYLLGIGGSSFSSDFPRFISARLNLDEYLAKAQNTSWLTFDVTSRRPGFAELSVSNNHFDYSFGNVALHIVETPSVIQVFPAKAVKSISTKSAISSAVIILEFPPLADALITNYSKLLYASGNSSVHESACSIPSFITPNTLLVSPNLYILWTNAPIDVVLPSTLDERSTNLAQCRFGKTIVSRTDVASGHISCLPPLLLPGAYEVSLSVGPRLLDYDFAATLHVTEISSNYSASQNVRFGSSAGGSEILLTPFNVSSWDPVLNISRYTQFILTFGSTPTLGNFVGNCVFGTTPPNKGYVTIEIATIDAGNPGSSHILATDIPFEYVGEPVVSDVYPTIGYVLEAVRLTVTGRHFLRGRVDVAGADMTTRVCLAGIPAPNITSHCICTAVSSAVLLADISLSMLQAPSFAEGFALVVSANDRNFAVKDTLSVRPRPRPMVLNVSLWDQQQAGGQDVRFALDGEHVLQDMALARCLFDSRVVVEAVIDSHGGLRCAAPALFVDGLTSFRHVPVGICVEPRACASLTAGSAGVSVLRYSSAVNGSVIQGAADVGSLQVRSRISSSGGSWAGVVLSGTFAVADEYQWIARIGGIEEVGSLRVDGGAQTVVFPVQKRSSFGFQPVELLHQDGSGVRGLLSASLELVPSPHVFTVYPRTYSIMGSLLLTISGANFVTPTAVGGISVHLVSDGSIFASTVLNSSRLLAVSSTCLLARHTTSAFIGPSSLSVSSNGINNVDPMSAAFPSDDHRLLAVRQPTVFGVEPTIGTYRSGALVTVVGEAFAGLQDADVSCFFDKTRIQSVWASEASCVCRLPLLFPGGLSAVTVGDSYPHQSSRSLVSAVTFAVEIESNITYAYPYFGRVGGGTSVTLLVNRSVAVTHCSFGLSMVAAECTGIRCSCISPAHAAGFVAVSISGLESNEQYMPSFKFEYVADIIVKRAVFDSIMTGLETLLMFESTGVMAHHTSALRLQIVGQSGSVAPGATSSSIFFVSSKYFVVNAAVPTGEDRLVWCSVGFQNDTTILLSEGLGGAAVTVHSGPIVTVLAGSLGSEYSSGNKILLASDVGQHPGSGCFLNGKTFVAASEEPSGTFSCPLPVSSGVRTSADVMNVSWSLDMRQQLAASVILVPRLVELNISSSPSNLLATFVSNQQDEYIALPFSVQSALPSFVDIVSCTISDGHEYRAFSVASGLTFECNVPRIASGFVPVRIQFGSGMWTAFVHYSFTVPITGEIVKAFPEVMGVAIGSAAQSVITICGTSFQFGSIVATSQFYVDNGNITAIRVISDSIALLSAETSDVDTDRYMTIRTSFRRKFAQIKIVDLKEAGGLASTLLSSLGGFQIEIDTPYAGDAEHVWAFLLRTVIRLNWNGAARMAAVSPMLKPLSSLQVFISYDLRNQMAVGSVEVFREKHALLTGVQNTALSMSIDRRVSCLHAGASVTFSVSNPTMTGNKVMYMYVGPYGIAMDKRSTSVAYDVIPAIPSVGFFSLDVGFEGGMIRGSFNNSLVRPLDPVSFSVRASSLLKTILAQIAVPGTSGIVLITEHVVDAVQCVFSFNFNGGMSVSDVTRISSRLLLCDASSVPSTSSIAELQLRFAGPYTDVYATYDALKLRIADAPSFFSSSVQMVPERGGALVDLRGTSLTTDNLGCLFITSSSNGVFVRATVVDGVRARCVSPTLPSLSESSSVSVYGCVPGVRTPLSGAPILASWIMSRNATISQQTMMSNVVTSMQASDWNTGLFNVSFAPVLSASLLTKPVTLLVSSFEVSASTFVSDILVATVPPSLHTGFTPVSVVLGDSAVHMTTSNSLEIVASPVFASVVGTSVSQPGGESVLLVKGSGFLKNVECIVADGSCVAYCVSSELLIVDVSLNPHSSYSLQVLGFRNVSLHMFARTIGHIGIQSSAALDAELSHDAPVSEQPGVVYVASQSAVEQSAGLLCVFGNGKTFVEPDFPSEMNGLIGCKKPLLTSASGSSISIQIVSFFSSTQTAVFSIPLYSSVNASGSELVSSLSGPQLTISLTSALPLSLHLDVGVYLRGEMFVGVLSVARDSVSVAVDGFPSGFCVISVAISSVRDNLLFVDGMFEVRPGFAVEDVYPKTIISSSEYTFWVRGRHASGERAEDICLLLDEQCADHVFVSSVLLLGGLNSSNTIATYDGQLVPLKTSVDGEKSFLSVPSSLAFSVSGRMDVQTLIPGFGAVIGGMPVLVVTDKEGQDVRGLDDRYCTIGKTFVRSRFQSSMVCVLPALAAGNYSVGFTSVDSHLFIRGATQQLTILPNITAAKTSQLAVSTGTDDLLLPAVRGFAAGGTSIGLDMRLGGVLDGTLGLSAVTRLLCVFEESTVILARISSMHSTAVCTTPATRAGGGYVAVRLAVGDLETSSTFALPDTGIQFEYVGEPVVSDVYPTIGYVLEAVRLTVTGRHFLRGRVDVAGADMTTRVCLAGIPAPNITSHCICTAVSSAVLLADISLSMLQAPSFAEGFALVVSANDRNFAVKDTLSVRPRPRPMVLNVSLWDQQQAGGQDVRFALDGEHVLQDMALARCLFDSRVVVEAVIDSHGGLRCAAPALFVDGLTSFRHVPVGICVEPRACASLTAGSAGVSVLRYSSAVNGSVIQGAADVGSLQVRSRISSSGGSWAGVVLSGTFAVADEYQWIARIGGSNVWNYVTFNLTASLSNQLFNYIAENAPRLIVRIDLRAEIGTFSDAKCSCGIGPLTGPGFHSLSVTIDAIPNVDHVPFVIHELPQIEEVFFESLEEDRPRVLVAKTLGFFPQAPTTKILLRGSEVGFLSASSVVSLLSVQSGATFSGAGQLAITVGELVMTVDADIMFSSSAVTRLHVEYFALSRTGGQDLRFHATSDVEGSDFCVFSSKTFVRTLPCGRSCIICPHPLLFGFNVTVGRSFTFMLPSVSTEYPLLNGNVSAVTSNSLQLCGELLIDVYSPTSTTPFLFAQIGSAVFPLSVVEAVPHFRGELPVWISGYAPLFISENAKDFLETGVYVHFAKRPVVVAFSTSVVQNESSIILQTLEVAESHLLSCTVYGKNTSFATTAKFVSSRLSRCTVQILPLSRQGMDGAFDVFASIESGDRLIAGLGSILSVHSQEFSFNLPELPMPGAKMLLDVDHRFSLDGTFHVQIGRISILAKKDGTSRYSVVYPLLKAENYTASLLENWAVVSSTTSQFSLFAAINVSSAQFHAIERSAVTVSLPVLLPCVSCTVCLVNGYHAFPVLQDVSGSGCEISRLPAGFHALSLSTNSEGRLLASANWQIQVWTRPRISKLISEVGIAYRNNRIVLVGENLLQSFSVQTRPLSVFNTHPVSSFLHVVSVLANGSQDINLEFFSLSSRLPCETRCSVSTVQISVLQTISNKDITAGSPVKFAIDPPVHPSLLAGLRSIFGKTSVLTASQVQGSILSAIMPLVQSGGALRVVPLCGSAFSDVSSVISYAHMNVSVTMNSIRIWNTSFSASTLPALTFPGYFVSFYFVSPLLSKLQECQMGGFAVPCIPTVTLKCSCTFSDVHAFGFHTLRLFGFSIMEDIHSWPVNNQERPVILNVFPNTVVNSVSSRVLLHGENLVNVGEVYSSCVFKFVSSSFVILSGTSGSLYSTVRDLSLSAHLLHIWYPPSITVKERMVSSGMLLSLAVEGTERYDMVCLFQQRRSIISVVGSTSMDVATCTVPLQHEENTTLLVRFYDSWNVLVSVISALQPANISLTVLDSYRTGGVLTLTYPGDFGDLFLSDGAAFSSVVSTTAVAGIKQFSLYGGSVGFRSFVVHSMETLMPMGTLEAHFVPLPVIDVHVAFTVHPQRSTVWSLSGSGLRGIEKFSSKDSDLMFSHASDRISRIEVPKWNASQSPMIYSSRGQQVPMLHDLRVVQVNLPENWQLSTQFRMARGGGEVRLLGVFSEDIPLFCLFNGKTFVRTRIFNNSELACMMPRAKQSMGAILTISDGRLRSFSTGTIHLISDYNVSSVDPIFVSEKGGVKLTFVSPNLPAEAGLVNRFRCKIGNSTVVTAEKESSTTLICTAPHFDLGPNIVEIGVDDEYSSDRRFVTYYEQPVIQRVSPVNTQGIGQIRLRGQNLPRGSIFCKFSSETRSIVLQGIGVSSRATDCSISVDLHHLSSRQDISISADRQVFSRSTHSIEVAASPTILSVYPSVGSRGGGCVVTVFGSHFKKSSRLFCSFGLFSSFGIWNSESEVLCIAPAQSPTTVPVSVASNLQFFPASTVSFSFIDSWNVTALSPAFGPVSGGTLVNVSGTGFSSGTAWSCSFGSVVVNASRISDSLLRCITPRQNSTTERLLTYVEVSPNGVEYSTDRKVFVYDLCPPGSFCSPSTGIRKACPKGFECPEYGLETALPCTPGSFANSTASVFCNPCSLGSNCPMFGGGIPTPCPAGKVCDVFGLYLPGRFCPPGHFCGFGTETYNPLSMSAYAPIPCPFGVYCSHGVAVNESQIGNYSTPQPCASGYVCDIGSTNPMPYSCPTGYYCPVGGSVTFMIPCPSGTYCRGVGNIVPLVCDPGTFNNRTGRSYCDDCPPGHVCPFYGMLAPISCPAGYVCDQYRSPRPPTLCPSGHYCPNGTETAVVNRALNTSEGIPRPCGSAVYCIFGVRTNETVPGDFTTPQVCLAGSYCPGKTGSIDNLCPPGTFCPTGSEAPKNATAGFYAIGGGPEQSKCLIGTFSNEEGLQNCKPCPPGFSCEIEGTVLPQLCPPGTYRSSDDTVYCQPCPQGTYSNSYGLSAIEQCTLCPAGYICAVEAMTNYTSQAEQCYEGYYCRSGTTLADLDDQKCPAGFFCRVGTTPLSRFDDACPAGYYCLEGTGFSQREQFKCEAGYYCPEGTSEANPTTSCPEGTTSNIASSAESDCYKDLEYLRVNGYVLQVDAFASTSTASSSSVLSASNVGTDILVTGSQAKGRSIFSLEAGKVYVFSFNWTQIPPLVYDEDFRLSLYAGYEISDLFAISRPKRVLESVSFPYRITDDSWFVDPSFNKTILFDFELSPRDDIYVRWEVELIYGLYRKEILQFAGTMTVDAPSPSRAQYGTAKQFSFVIFSNQQLSVPSNALYTDPNPTKDEAKMTVAFSPTQSGVPIVPDPSQVVTKNFKSFWVSQGKLFSTQYIPFFSSCYGFGSYLRPFRVFENASNPDCTFVPPDVTVPINEWDPFLTATGDVCSLKTLCNFEEDLTKTDANPRFYESLKGITLFYVTQFPIDYSDFSSGETFFAPLKDSDFLVPVSVLDGTGGGVPKKVSITFSYMQVDPKQKRILYALVSYGSEKLPAGEREYSLTVTLELLQYFDILNHFGFGLQIYVVIYLAVAFTSIVSISLFWAANRLAIRMKNPPPFHPIEYLKLASPPLFGGFGAYMLPFSSFCGFVYYVFLMDGNFLLIFPSSKLWFQAQAGEYDVLTLDDEDQMIAWRSGRIGTVFVIAGLYIIKLGSQLLIGDNDLAPEDRFTVYIYAVIVGLKFIQPLYERFMFGFLTDAVLVVPNLVVFSLLQFVITMGADTFIDFMIGYLIDLVMEVIMRIYLGPLVAHVTAKLPDYKRKVIYYLRKWFQKDGSEELEYPQDEVEMDPIVPVIESLVVYSIGDLSMMFAPVVIGFLYLFRKETMIGNFYGIRDSDFIFFLAFGIVIIFSQSVMDAFLDHLLELYKGWKIQEYMEVKREMYLTRESRWMLSTLEYDYELEPQLRPVDAMAFSPQYFFLMTLQASSMLLIVFGLEITFRANYVMFGDPLFLLLVMATCAGCTLWKKLFGYLGQLSPIWKLPSLEFDDPEIESTSKDEMEASDSAKQERDLELSQLETVLSMFTKDNDPDSNKRRSALVPALNMPGSEINDSNSGEAVFDKVSQNTFRHVFIGVNRPWLVERIRQMVSQFDRTSSDSFEAGNDDGQLYTCGHLLVVGKGEDPAFLQVHFPPCPTAPCNFSNDLQVSKIGLEDRQVPDIPSLESDGPEISKVTTSSGEIISLRTEQLARLWLIRANVRTETTAANFSPYL
eukprot:ANDGO_00631.mRNA.1 hypothetical protein GUITHDRAFT_146773